MSCTVQPLSVFEKRTMSSSTVHRPRPTTTYTATPPQMGSMDCFASKSLLSFFVQNTGLLQENDAHLTEPRFVVLFQP